jgi:hypothetical protein
MNRKQRKHRGEERFGLRFASDTLLNVQANMIHPRNGESQLRFKSKGRFTGERLLRQRPRIYRWIVELLAEPGMSINQITNSGRLHKVSTQLETGKPALQVVNNPLRSARFK